MTSEIIPVLRISLDGIKYSDYTNIRSVPPKGAARDRHGRGAGCDGRGCAFDERRKSGRQSRVVLTPRGESGVTVVTTLVCFFILHARLRARRAPGIPCALSFKGRTYWQNSDALRRENAESYSGVITREGG
jgi:hypothetical protein